MNYSNQKNSTVVNANRDIVLTIPPCQ